ncbi:MAG: hypothetical protein A2X84_05140 [Desulfuromonadaceae bacterium GWC2_58_13]|nr:MAG: hypothetical protein A2X84_05140 [Desulfuromonadaceae bacterium GWC2_58_13]
MSRRFSAILPMCAGLLFLWLPRPAAADSLSLLTDLKYEIGNSETTEKATGDTWENERTLFSQLYSLDVQKEVMPNLKLNLGGLFDRDDIDSNTTDPDSLDSDTENIAIRPYLDLQLSSPFIRASTSYRKSEIKQGSSIAETRRAYSEEYRASLGWEPVEWPEIDFDFTRNQVHNEPLTNDQRIDNYQLRSRYDYEDFRFTYSHTTNDALNNFSDFKTLTETDNGSIRFNRNFLGNKISVNSSLRAGRQAIEFTGPGDRVAPTTSAGAVIGSIEDISPLTSDPDEGFTLDQIELLVNSVLPSDPLSFGLDFGAATDVDRLYVTFAELVDSESSVPFSWEIYIRDHETEAWTRLTPIQVVGNTAESRFEFAFPPVETRYIKILTRPLARTLVPAEGELRIVEISGQRTLPPATSELITTDWTGDLSVNVKHTDRTSTGYDFLYREQRMRPLDEKKTQMNTGIRLRHRFDQTFVGNVRLQRSETREQEDQPRTDYNFSAALAAKYLETFDQSLTYSYSRQRDENADINTSNAVFLRSNVDLYDGWSLYLDNGYSQQQPSEGGETTTTFIRAGSNIVPNHWLNLNLSYGVSWAREPGKEVTRDQDGRLILTLVPTSALSLSADLAFSDETGEGGDSTAEQQYFINWSPFRDGNLLFSLSYGQSRDTEEEAAWTLSPTLRWKMNPKTLLTLEYALGEREDRTEIVEFENISLALRFFF